LELPNGSSLLKVNVYFAIRGKKVWQNSLSTDFAETILQISAETILPLMEK